MLLRCTACRPLGSLIGLPRPASSIAVVPLMVWCLLWPRGVDESVFFALNFWTTLSAEIHCIAERESTSRDQNIICSARDLE